MPQAKNIPKQLKKALMRERLLQLCKEHAIASLSIFGSFAQGKDTPNSDVDILIVFKKNERKSLLDLIRIENELSVLFQKKVDLVTMEGLNPYLKNEVLNSMQTLYETG